MSSIWDELMETFRHGHHGHHRPKAPPNPAFINRLVVDTRYFPNRHQRKFLRPQMSRAQLSFDLPTTRTDGSDLPPDQIASTDVFDDLSDGNGSKKIGSITGAGTSFATGTLAVGSHSFTVVVNDTSGHKSAPSNVAALSIAPTLAAPSAVSNLTATLIEE